MLRGDLRVRAIRTFHPVPSLAYVLVRRVSKLRAELQGLSGPEIAAKRRAGENVSEHEDRLELAYATDTLINVFDHAPELYQARVLVMECTFLDARKTLEAARSGCHIHLDELLERAGSFHNQALVLMHFSQMYQPAEVRRILGRRCPPELANRIVVLAPESGAWPG